jgi:hypothetical protein
MRRGDDGAFVVIPAHATTLDPACAGVTTERSSSFLRMQRRWIRHAPG